MRTIAIGILMMTAACVGPFDAPIACTAELRSTLTLRIVNAATGAREGIGSTVIVRRPGVYDSVTVVSDVSERDYVGWEHEIGAGVYSVTVRKPGFVSQAFSAAVTADECHAGPGPHIEVRLVPAP